MAIFIVVIIRRFVFRGCNKISFVIARTVCDIFFSFFTFIVIQLFPPLMFSCAFLNTFTSKCEHFSISFYFIPFSFNFFVALNLTLMKLYILGTNL